MASVDDCETDKASVDEASVDDCEDTASVNNFEDMASVDDCEADASSMVYCHLDTVMVLHCVDLKL